jgi:putative membrane protein
MTDSVQPRIEKIDATTKLAVDRTRLAYERTLMAWVRTAISLISFGFTIYKFFQIESAGRQDGVVSATEFSVLMIVFGLVSLLMATLEHRRDLNALRAEFQEIPPRSLARVLAALISLLGIVALVTVLLRR